MKERKQAAALHYQQGETSGAPRIVAVGEGLIAEKILEIAAQHDLPVYRDVETVRKLVKMKSGQTIPPELYAAVAKILAFLYRLEQGQKREA